MNLDAYCRDVIPDFAPLGGNRPDCAVVMAVLVSLVENPRQWSLPCLILPPDVLDTAMAMVCATIVIRSASEIIEPPPERRTGRWRGDRLSCRLEAASDAALDGFRADYYASDDTDFDSDDDDRHAMPWRNFVRVYLQINLPDSITSGGNDLLQCCLSLFSVDLRNTKLHTVGGRLMRDCRELTAAHLPDTIHTVGVRFLQYCNNLVSIDLRNTKLRDQFMSCCRKLTKIHLPDTLHTVGVGFLQYCGSLVSIDLRHTELRVVGDGFIYKCVKLSAVHLPAALQVAKPDWCRLVVDKYHPHRFLKCIILTSPDRAV